jgi:hypothetical protein
MPSTAAVAIPSRKLREQIAAKGVIRINLESSEISVEHLKTE